MGKRAVLPAVGGGAALKMAELRWGAGKKRKAPMGADATRGGAERERLKKMAAEAAVDEVKSGMVLGIGTGSTVKHAILKLGRLVSEGLEVTAIPTSLQTEKLCLGVGVPLGDVNEYDSIDLCIDGADEVDRKLNLIKGGGGALTREKIVAGMAKKFFVVVDAGKLVEGLGAFPVAVECLEFGKTGVAKRLAGLGASVSERDFVTDNGNRILDAALGKIENPKKLEKEINNVPGVLENGIFPKEFVNRVYVGAAGGLRVLRGGG